MAPPDSAEVQHQSEGRRGGGVKRRRETAASRRFQENKSRTPNAFARRSPPREPSPIKSESSEDDRPRKQKRPGRGAAIAAVQRESVEQSRRDREEREKREAVNRVSNHADMVAEHYNNVEQRGREWRSTQSQIKGLRSLNNWIKSTLIQKFSRPDVPVQHLTVLDLACGKGGDLGKWEKAPQVPSLYVGCDIASVSIDQARERYQESARKRGRNWRAPRMDAQFYVQDTFKPELAQIPILKQVGFNPNAGPGGPILPGMPSGGFDVVSMMFALHYSFESEELARGLLKNVAGALKKGGRFIGVMPNSDVISAKVKELMSDELANSTPNEPAIQADEAVNTVDSGAAETDEDWDPERPSEPRPESNGNSAGSDDEWDPEKPSEPVLAASNGIPGDGSDDDWDPEKPSEPAGVDLQAEHPTVSNDNSNPIAPVKPAATPRPTGPPLEWGNKLYSVRVPRWQNVPQKAVPADGIFRPPYGWKYDYHLVEAVEVPEYIVPWEALRAMAEEYGLELLYRKAFADVLQDESEDPDLGQLAERMGVKSRDRSVGGGTGLLVSAEEMEAASFYHAFCFYKT